MNAEKKNKDVASLFQDFAVHFVIDWISIALMLREPRRKSCVQKHANYALAYFSLALI